MLANSANEILPFPSVSASSYLGSSGWASALVSLRLTFGSCVLELIVAAGVVGVLYQSASISSSTGPVEDVRSIASRSSSRSTS